MFILIWNCLLSTEPEYNFSKQVSDLDSYEKETAIFETQVSDREAKVEWYFNDKVVYLLICFDLYNSTIFLILSFKYISLILLYFIFRNQQICLDYIYIICITYIDNIIYIYYILYNIFISFYDIHFKCLIYLYLKKLYL